MSEALAFLQDRTFARATTATALAYPPERRPTPAPQTGEPDPHALPAGAHRHGPCVPAGTAADRRSAVWVPGPARLRRGQLHQARWAAARRDLLLRPAGCHLLAPRGDGVGAGAQCPRPALADPDHHPWRSR